MKTTKVMFADSKNSNKEIGEREHRFFHESDWESSFSKKNAYEKRFPASCTKVATLAYVPESPYCDIKKKIIVSKEVVQIIKDSEKARDNFSKYPSYLQEMTGTPARFIAGDEINI
ncbi:hypothetical protein ACTFIR_009790 [Dictyostelium discoideum]